MQLTGFVHPDGVRHIGAVEGSSIRDLGTATSFFSDHRAARSSNGGAEFPVSSTTRTPAVPETSRIFCVGVNYHSHAGESKDLAGVELPTAPLIFGRWQQSLVTDGTPVPVPPNEEGLDWEVELAVVIGDPIWAAAAATVLSTDSILGYAAFNDLSARRKQLSSTQFTIGKNADFSGPISDVVTVDSAGDPARGLRVTTHVNGELMQDARTDDLIFGIAEIIEYLTDTLTLLPGDVIATGTPGGVGAGRTPQVFLRPGDEVEVSVETVGSVRNPIIAR